MSGVKWPHQMSPRHLGSIVDRQVLLWEMRQDHPDDVPAKVGAKGANAGQVGAPQAEVDENTVRHPWLRFWGDAIVAELTRLGQADGHGEAFLNDGMNESPSKEPAPHAKPNRRTHH